MSVSSTTDPFTMVPTSERWITEVPSQWDMRRLKTLFRERSVKGYPDLPLLAATQTKGVVTKETYGLRTVIAQSGLENLKLVEPGDFVISLRSFEGGIEVSHARGIISPAYTVLRIKDQSLHGYFVRLFKSRYFLDAIRLSVTGIREGQNVDYARLGRSLVTVPTPASCQAIVRYLDHAELRIAKAIAAKQRMIALLDEREELALLQAITQSDRQKTTDSRLDWLGEFPAHWDVKRLGSLLEERNEMNADRQVQQVLSLVRKRGVMRYEDKGRIGNKRSDDVARYKVVREGDIVLNSMNVIIGSVGQSSYTGCLSPVYYVLKPRSNEHQNAYFNALFQVERFHSSLVRFGKGILAHRLRIPMIDLKTVMLPVPPPDEQLAIADRVVKATAELRAAKAGIEAEITLLKEYRIRLISDVVTGKLDVREEAAKLPDIDPMELATVAVGENGEDEEATDDD